MKKNVIIISLLSVLLLITGCASYIERDHERTTEQTLLRAGFKPIAITPANQRRFQKLPLGKVSAMSYHGKRYFLYPDHEHQELLIGGNKQFMQYNELLTDQIAPPSELSKEVEREWVESTLWGFY